MKGDELQAVMVRLPPDLLAELRASAEASDRTLSAEIRRAVRQYVERLRSIHHQ